MPNSRLSVREHESGLLAVNAKQAGMSRAAERFGFRAETPFREGLRRTIAWFEDRIAAGATAAAGRTG